MVIDRYCKAVFTVIAIALAALALHPWVARLRPPAAEAQGGRVEYEVTLPRAWGKVVGYSNGNVLLEAADGTLRDVDLRGKPPEYPRVKAMARWQ